MLERLDPDPEFWEGEIPHPQMVHVRVPGFPTNGRGEVEAALIHRAAHDVFLASARRT